MTSTFRKILFWMHLVAGVIAGLVVAVMSFTGVALAFESQIVDWADRDTRRVQVPAPDAPRLPIDELVARVRAAKPEAQVSGVTVYPEPDAVVLVGTGRGSGVYVDPYTGEVREQGAKGWRGFFHVMEEWHRWLAAEGDNRPVGKAITGVCNAAFFFLALSGLYLWFPRKWTRRIIRPSIWFRSGLRGKARDWNWHNVIGFWTLPVLVVLTLSGMVISYKWASDLVFKVTGNEPPAAQGPAAPPQVKVPPPPPGTKPQSLDALFAEARKQSPAWENISLRMGGAPRGNAPQGGPQGAAQKGPREGAPQGAASQGAPREGLPPSASQDTAPQGAPREGAAQDAPRDTAPQGTSREGGPQAAPREGAPPADAAPGAQRGGAPGGPQGQRPGGGGGGGPQASAFTIKERDAWPLFASAQVALDPFTGQVLRRENFSDYNSGRQLRTWLRFLHTGEALGWVGQLIAAIASLGGLFLVWTGYALAWRRFFPRRHASAVPAAADAASVRPETTA